MNKFTLFTLLIVMASSGAFSLQGDKSGKTGNKASSTIVYTCPMHPDVKSDSPGKCPTCGMNLVKNVSADGAGSRKTGGCAMKGDCCSAKKVGMAMKDNKACSRDSSGCKRMSMKGCCEH